MLIDLLVTIASCASLGEVLRQKGDYDGALVEYRKALLIQESTLGMNHPDTATSYNNIGVALHMKGDYDGALCHSQKEYCLCTQTEGQLGWGADASSKRHFKGSTPLSS